MERDSDIQTVLGQFAIRVTDIPVLRCRGDLAPRNPTNAEAADCFGLNAGIDGKEAYDLIVVGASGMYEARCRRCFEPGIPKQEVMEFARPRPDSM